jgi:hypothetical protein
MVLKNVRVKVFQSIKLFEFFVNQKIGFLFIFGLGCMAVAQEMVDYVGLRSKEGAYSGISCTDVAK